MKKYKILLDTDIGDDIDDLLCLQLGLNLNEVEFIGITTVFKNTQLRARMVNKVLKMNNISNIPVYAGYGDGIKQKNDKDVLFCQYEDDLNSEEYKPINYKDGCNGSSAIDFIIESVKKYGQELIILGIGPFTNIAKAIQKAPDIMKNVGRIVVMGGAFFSHFIEWNITCDVYAAKILNDFEKTIEYISADVTHQCFFDENQYNYLINYNSNDYRNYISKLLYKWREMHKITHIHPYLHDPLALMYIVQKDIVKMKNIIVKIETEGTITKGMTLNYDSCFIYNPNRPIGKRNMASYSVDSKKFIQEYIDIVYNKKIVKGA